jgi:hypothetical protein
VLSLLLLRRLGEDHVLNQRATRWVAVASAHGSRAAARGVAGGVAHEVASALREAARARGLWEAPREEH